MRYLSLKHLAALLAVLIATAGQLQAAVVLQLDLSAENHITISATTAVSLASVSGSDLTGVYLKDFFGGAPQASLGATRLSGDLVYFNATSDTTPSLFRLSDNDPGLNLYSMDNGTPSPASFSSGVQAFKGSATWSVSPEMYALFLQAPASGDVYAFADSIDDLTGGPMVIGQYSASQNSASQNSAVPEPTSIAVFGLGALGMAYRARRKIKCKT